MGQRTARYDRSVKSNYKLSITNYDGKELFRREYYGGFSFRYESPVFGDVLN